MSEDHKHKPLLKYRVVDDVKSHDTIKLISGDKKEFVVDRKHALISILVQMALEQDVDADEVHIPEVGASSLEKVIEYMNHHEGIAPPIIPKPIKSKDMRQVCSDAWDAEWIDKISDTRLDLYSLICAANFMDIKSLLHLACAKVASLIKGQPLEEIHNILARGTPLERNPLEHK